MPTPTPKTTMVYVCPQTRMAEITSAGFALWWTILLLLPVHLFPTNLVFLGLQRMSSEHGWVMGTALTFAVQIIGWKSGSPVVRWTGCMMSGLLWVFVATGICIGSHKWHMVLPVNTGFVVYGLTATKNLYCAAFVLPKYCVPQVYLMSAQLKTRLRTLRRLVCRTPKGE